MTTVLAPAAQTESISAHWVRRVFSFPVMLAGTLIALMVLTLRDRFSDPDMWWHLKTGEIIWKTHRIPHNDVFSYTTAHHAWIPHEWLSQLVIYGAYHYGGYPGLMVWLCFMGSVLVTGGFLLCSLYSGNAKVAWFGAIVVWLFATIGLSIRPQLIGYSLLIVELLILHLGRTRSERWLYLLPPLFAIWINCHGSFFLGLIVANAFLFCSFFRFRLGSLLAVPWESRARKVLVVVAPLSLLALLLNPGGLKQVMYPIETLKGMPLQMTFVSEWQPTELTTNIRGVALLGIAAAILVLALTRKADLWWHELVLLGLGFWLAASHQRMLFPFGILVAPTLCRMLANSWDNYDFRRDRILPNAVMIAMAAATVTVGYPRVQRLNAQVLAGNPVKAVDFMKAHHLAGNLLNDYVFGGYLIWSAPAYPVFLDGRGDVFEWTGVLGDFDKWAMLQGDPRELLEKYKIDIILIAPGSPMAHVLPLMTAWRLVYTDDQAMLFTRATVDPQH